MAGSCGSLIGARLANYSTCFVLSGLDFAPHSERKSFIRTSGREGRLRAVFGVEQVIRLET
jgi:hypothetical protein